MVKAGWETVSQFPNSLVIHPATETDKLWYKSMHTVESRHNGTPPDNSNRSPFKNITGFH